MAINLTGQLTTGDANNIGNNSNYIRVEYMKQKMISSQIGGSDVEEEVVVVRIGVWKSKASFNNGKQPIQGFGARILNEIKERYILDAAILATCLSISVACSAGAAAASLSALLFAFAARSAAAIASCRALSAASKDCSLPESISTRLCFFD